MKLKTTNAKKKSRETTASVGLLAPEPSQKHRGRQRCQVAEAAILKATVDLLKEQSLRDVTADAIADRAGVSKATIYKWWPNKNRVALDAFLSQWEKEVPIQNTGSVVEDFPEQLVQSTRFYTSRYG